jgi:hypothetical protein
LVDVASQVASFARGPPDESDCPSFSGLWRGTCSDRELVRPGLPPVCRGCRETVGIQQAETVATDARDDGLSLEDPEDPPGQSSASTRARSSGAWRGRIACPSGSPLVTAS